MDEQELRMVVVAAVAYSYREEEREATTEHSAKGPLVTSCLSYNLSVAQTGHAAQL